MSPHQGMQAQFGSSAPGEPTGARQDGSHRVQGAGRGGGTGPRPPNLAGHKQKDVPGSVSGTALGFALGDEMQAIVQTVLLVGSKRKMQSKSKVIC